MYYPQRTPYCCEHNGDYFLHNLGYKHFVRTYMTDFKVEIGELIPEDSDELDSVVFRTAGDYDQFISSLRSIDRAFSSAER